MKTHNAKSTAKNVSTALKTATLAIRTAGIAAVTAVTETRAGLAVVIRDQVAIMTAAGVSNKVISKTVRAALTGLAKPNTINVALIRAGVRLRGKRNDTAALKAADGLIGLSLKDKPVTAINPKAPADKGGDDKGGDDDTGGKGHTVATLAALLASLPAELVDAAVIAASLARRTLA
jgi:hypothetical protein